MKEAGAQPARDACKAGAVPLFTMLAADDTVNEDARATVIWALGYVIKLSGNEGIVQSREAGCLQLLIRLVHSTVMVAHEVCGRAVWALRVLAEVGGPEMKAEARAADALVVLTSTLEQNDLPDWIRTYLREAIITISEEASRSVQNSSVLPNTPRGF